MDRIPKPMDSIVDRPPIVVESKAPEGYRAIRTTIQLRVAEPTEGGAAFDAAINTEVRLGPPHGRSSRWTGSPPSENEDLETLVAEHHLQLSQQLVGAIAMAHSAKLTPNGGPLQPEGGRS